MEKEMKVRCYHILKGEPVISLGLGRHPYFRGVEVYRWADGRWDEVSPIDVMFKGREINETHFGLRHPIAYAARRWLPRTEAVQDPENAMLDRIIAMLEERKAERLAQEGPPDQPPEAAA